MNSELLETSAMDEVCCTPSEHVNNSWTPDSTKKQ